MELIKTNQYQWVILGAGIFLLLMLQTGIAQALSFGAFANLLLLFGITATFNRPDRHVLIISLVLGLMCDFASGLPDGVFLLAIPATLLTLRFVLTRLLPSQDSFFVTAFTASAAILAFYAISLLVIFAFELIGLLADYNFILVIRHLWLELLLNLAFFYPVLLYYRVVARLSRYEI